jgi:hypothetical protein
VRCAGFEFRQVLIGQTIKLKRAGPVAELFLVAGPSRAGDRSPMVYLSRRPILTAIACALRHA